MVDRYYNKQNIKIIYKNKTKIKLKIENTTFDCCMIFFWVRRGLEI